MGLFDKVKNVTADLGEKTQNAIDAKLEERDATKKALQAEKEKNQQLLSTFKASKELGDISIDTENRLFKVKHATSVIKKNSGALKKTGKALAAVYTMGASIAIEAAMKPDDKVFSFDDLDSYELIEDESTISGGGLGSTIAGGILFGGAGAIAGSVTGKKKTKKTVENLVLQINTKDISFPCVMVTYINKSTKTSSNAYKEALSLAKQSIQCLDLIIKSEEEYNAPQPSVKELDVTTQIKKYKELLDMGAITEDEFNAKKKELLRL